MVEVMHQHYPTRAKLPPIIVLIIIVFISKFLLLNHITTKVNMGMQTEMTPTMDTARYKLIEISKFRQNNYNLPSTMLRSNVHFTSKIT